MEEKRIYKLNVISNQANNGEIRINNFFNMCDFNDCTDAYIMVNNVIGIRPSIDILSLAISCSGLINSYDNFNDNFNIQKSTQLEIIPATVFKNNANVSEAYFYLNNVLDNWSRISISELNNIKINVEGLFDGLNMDFPLAITIKIKLLKK